MAEGVTRDDAGGIDLSKVDDLKHAAKQRRTQKLPWRRTLLFVARLTLTHPFLFSITVLLALGLAAVTIFNLSLAVPFFDLLQGEGQAPVSDSVALGFMAPLFEGLSDVDAVRLIAILLFAGAVLMGAFLYGYARNAQYLQILIDRDLRTRLFDAAMSADFAYLQRQKTTNLFTLLHSFPGAISKTFAEYVKAIHNVTTFAAVAIALWLVSWQMTLVAAAIAIVVNLIVIQLGRLIARFAYDIRETRLELHRQTMESLQGIKLIRLFGREQQTQDDFATRIRAYRINQFKKASTDALVSPLQNVLTITFVSTLLVIATFILANQTSAWVPTLALFMIVATRFSAQGGKYAKRRTTIAGEIPEIEAVMDFLDDKAKDRMKDGKTVCTGLRDNLRFENVHFGYDADEPEVVKGIDLTIGRGQMVALVGASGAGKSTIVDLVTRLYDPTAGRITVDGVDVREFRAGTWRRHVAVVSQNAFLFNASVRDNIRFGRLAATDAEVEEAAMGANAHEFIIALPQGYDTPIGERGARLSGGQAQRLAIARAMLADPQLLILDEATSALDAETEHKVQDAIERLGRNRTILAVAHRLSTIKKADTIVVLEEGRIVEQGDHDTLLAKRSRYWDYVRMQDLGGTQAQGHHGVDALWIRLTLHRGAAALVPALREAQGVRAVRADGVIVEIVADADDATLPRILALIGARGSRVETLRVEGQTEEGTVRLLPRNAGRRTRLLVELDRDAAGVMDVFADSSDVRVLGHAGPLVELEVGRATQTVPDLLRVLGRRRFRVRGIRFANGAAGSMLPASGRAPVKRR